ncbi:MAG: DUF2185 domain-containing protein [Polyangiaceae bacterium]
MPPKRLRFTPDQLEPLTAEVGTCIASDKIVVDGEAVGFMVREASTGPRDSGWRFFSGSESLDYMNDPSKLGVHELNLLANCDRDVVPLLAAPIGSAFERAGDELVETLAELP